GDLIDTSDTTNFISQPITGDAVLSTRLISEANVAAWAKSGLMVRGSSDPQAPTYIVERNAGDGSISVGVRANTGGSLNYVVNADPMTLPAYLRITRSGNTFTAATSTDGVT